MARAVEEKPPPAGYSQGMKAVAAPFVLALSLLVPMTAAADGVIPPPPEEEFHYRWHLGKLLGVVAGLFLPSHGDGRLTFEPTGNGALRTELLITSEKSDEGEYWRYGSKIDLGSGRTVEAWSSYFWRGEEKSKRGEISGEGVFDVASAIYQLRRNPPEKPRHLEIWSDGKIYPVVVIPLGEEKRSVDGRKIATRHYSVRGIRKTGQRHWKGRFELWLADDAVATPVEIFIERSMAGVRLELASY